MNAHPDFRRTNMTSKGQVLIPKDVRERAGLIPGKPVRVGINDRGEAVVAPEATDEGADGRRARVLEAIESVRGSMNTGFRTTDEYMDFIRPHRHDTQ